jgi:hypothetical protein
MVAARKEMILRGPGGRWLAGGASPNPGGRPADSARRWALIRGAISDDEVVRIARRLLEAIDKGDVSAAKLLLSYVLGPPMPEIQPGTASMGPALSSLPRPAQIALLERAVARLRAEDAAAGEAEADDAGDDGP